MDSKLTSRNYYILHITYYIYIIIIYYSLTYIINIYYIDTLFPSRRKSRLSPIQNELICCKNSHPPKKNIFNKITFCKLSLAAILHKPVIHCSDLNGLI